MSRTDLLPSICLSALLAVSTTGAAVAASPMPKPVLLPVVRVINQKPEAPAAEPAAPAAEPAAPAAPAAPAPTSGADFGSVLGQRTGASLEAGRFTLNLGFRFDDDLARLRGAQADEWVAGSPGK